MVRGASPGPPPAAQARASNSRLTRSSWRTCPHRKLRRNVPRVDGALTTQPSTRAVPPVRNTSASSMQSPPASADATSVISLSPGLARPVALPRSKCRSTSWGRPRWLAKVVGRISPALATRRWSSKVIWMRSGWSSGSIYWVLLVSGRFCVSKAIIPEAQEHFLIPSARRDTHLFGGLRLRWIRVYGQEAACRAGPEHSHHQPPVTTVAGWGVVETLSVHLGGGTGLVEFPATAMIPGQTRMLQLN